MAETLSNIFVNKHPTITPSTKADLLKTSEQWYNDTYPNGELVILDPDGWDRTNYEYSWSVQLISFETFGQRVARSTIMANKIALDKLAGVTR